MTRLLSRRSSLGLISAGSLGGCAAAGRSPFFSTIANFRRSSTPALDREKVLASPFASIQAWFEGNSKALLVLGEYAASQRLVWYSADHQSVTTWGPFVVRVLGLDVDVRDIEMIGNWERDLRALTGRRLERRVIFQAKRETVSMRTVSSFRIAGDEEVGLLTGRMRLQKIVENVVANGAHRYSNFYWVDKSSGFCWQSRQLVIPTMTPFNLRVAKPPIGGQI